MNYKIMTLKDLSGEIWVDVIGYDGIYEVSNLGRIKSLRRLVNTRWNTGRIVNEKILKQSYCKKNRTLTISLQSRSIQVSRVVFDSFNTEVVLSKNECIMHKNKILTDNRIVNLEKATREKSKATDMIKSQRTIMSTPKNFTKAITTRNEFYKNRAQKECNICKKTLLLELFIIGHNECKVCYNARMREKREVFVETRTEKKCTKCLKTKKIELFPKHNKSYCKECSNKYALTRRHCKK